MLPKETAGEEKSSMALGEGDKLGGHRWNGRGKGPRGFFLDLLSTVLG